MIQSDPCLWHILQHENSAPPLGYRSRLSHMLQLSSQLLQGSVAKELGPLTAFQSLTVTGSSWTSAGAPASIETYRQRLDIKLHELMQVSVRLVRCQNLETSTALSSRYAWTLRSSGSGNVKAACSSKRLPCMEIGKACS